MNKVFSNADDAIRDVPDGATLMVGGFGMCGVPVELLDALQRRGSRGLTVISNNAGTDGFGLGRLLETGQVRKMISSYVGENRLFETLVLRGELELELNPQGTLSERIRAGGAGIPAFYTPAGIGTIVADGKEQREFRNKKYLLEHALTADFAFVKAWKGDRAGNLIYKRTARNFNPMMATAAAVTIAEVEELVEPGQLDPNFIVTPGIYVKRIFQCSPYPKGIERRTVRRTNRG